MQWLKRNRLYFAVFGGLLGTVALVSLLALIDSGEFSTHVWFRSLLHIPWGCALYLLFVRLNMLLEDARPRLWQWRGFYALPFGAVLGLALNQEFLLSSEGFGGDFHHAATAAAKLGIKTWIVQAKSFADIAGWCFGALAAAWFCYFCAVRLETARQHYLADRHARRRNRDRKLS